MEASPLCCLKEFNDFEKEEIVLIWQQANVITHLALFFNQE